MVVFYGLSVEMDWLFKITHKASTLNSTRYGTLGPTIERTLADVKLEAAFFLADSDGQWSGTIGFDMKEHCRLRDRCALVSRVQRKRFVSADMNPQNLARLVHRLAALQSTPEK
jgi:hypothetical protein